MGQIHGATETDLTNVVSAAFRMIATCLLVLSTALIPAVF